MFLYLILKKVNLINKLFLLIYMIILLKCIKIIFIDINKNKIIIIFYFFYKKVFKYKMFIIKWNHNKYIHKTILKILH